MTLAKEHQQACLLGRMEAGEELIQTSVHQPALVVEAEYPCLAAVGLMQVLLQV